MRSAMPPKHGAELVINILGDKANYEAWKKELSGMADRILEVRSLLRKGLEDKGTPGTWNHITDQIGMFSFTGLTKLRCERLIDKHSIYLLKSGRISLAGLNKSNIQYMIDSVDEVVRNAPAEVTPAEAEMKVSTNKSVGFYIRAATSFLKGIEAREATDDKAAVEAKDPVDMLTISGLGEAINTAVAAATRAEADGLGEITKVETQYPDMTTGRGCARIVIEVKRKK